MLTKLIKDLLSGIFAFFLLGCSFFSLGAMRSNDYFSNGDRSMRMFDQLAAMEKVDKQIETLKAKMKTVREQHKGKSDEEICKLDPQFKYYVKEIEALTNSGSFWAMVGQDLSLSLAKSIGAVIDGRVKSAGDRLVVPLCESIVDWIIKSWQKGVSLFFHQSKDPFTRQELERWSNIIVTDLTGFGILIKGRGPFDSRSKELAGRTTFDSDVEVTISQDQLLNELIIKRYAEQCENYAEEIERRKGYYKDNREVVFIANQIIMTLLEFRQIILSIKSIKDVAAKFGQDITVITEMQKNIKNLFAELIHAAIPTSYLDPKKDSSLSNGQQRQSFPLPYGNDDWQN